MFSYGASFDIDAIFVFVFRCVYYDIPLSSTDAKSSVI